MPFDRIFPRDEIERESITAGDLWSRDELIRELGGFNVLVEMAKTHAEEEHLAGAVKRIAPRFAEENPVELITRILDWVVRDLNSLAEEARRACTVDLDRAKRLARELGFRRNKAVRFFQRLLRLDQPVPGIPGSGFLNIPTVTSMLKGESCDYDVGRVRARLASRIFGEKVIDVVDPGDNDHRAVAGTDASVGEVRVEHRRGSFIPPTPASLFVAGAAMKVRDGGLYRPYWDYDVDPRDLSAYEDVEAAVKGLLISPRLRDEVITDFRHLKAAAMELRQYGEENRVLGMQARWRPVGSVPELGRAQRPSLLIRDGRIFPLVHRLDDYDGASAPDDILYSEIVRREIIAFRDVFSKIADMHSPVYAGAVKSPEFSWLSMMVFWYLETNGMIRSNGGFYRPPLNDQAVIHLLLWGLAEERGEDFYGTEAFAFTFGILRRFSDIAFPKHPIILSDADRILNEDSEDDWWSFIKEHIEEGWKGYGSSRRGVPPLAEEEYEPFLTLCRKCGVVMFYGFSTAFYRQTVASRSHFFTPRWEIAVKCNENPPASFSYKRDRLLKWISDPGCMVSDDFHPVAGFEKSPKGLPLFIPDVVQEAHQVVYYTQDRHVPEVTERLQEVITLLRSRLGA